MRRRSWLLPLTLVLAPYARADVKVHEAQGRVDVAATAAPLAEVLDRLARQIGMKVVYEGPAPRQLVTLSLAGRSPAEAVAAILEGQGLNYALVLDETATRVDQLLVTGTASSGSGATPARASPPTSPRMRPPVLRPTPQDDEDEAEEEPAADQPASDTPPPTDKGQPQPPPSPKPPGTTPPGAAPSPGVTPPPGLVPFTPTPTYSSSPFNPKPIPMFPTAPQPTPTPTPAATPP